MSVETMMTAEELTYVRDMAKQQMGYAHLPVMEERKKNWTALNSLRGTRPMIVMEMSTFEGEMLPPLHCTSPLAREIEQQLLIHTINHELIDDDKVVPDCFTVGWSISIRSLDMDIQRRHGIDAEGRQLGFADEHPIVNLGEDFSKLKPSVLAFDREGTLRHKALIEEVLGDIMPVRLKGALEWFFTPSAKIIELMGMEAMLIALMDQPEDMHRLYRFIVDDMIRTLTWMETEQLLTLNNGNDYVGSGSCGFTTELPTEACKQTGIVRPKDLWANMNSQETVGISPSMYREFIFPYYREMAEHFGRVYYGCCEPVHEIWDDCISQLPNLRKVSISAWCDEAFMGERLRGSRVIYSRKPSPNLIGVGAFHEDAYRQHMARTLTEARGCQLELIYRDIYTLVGDRARPGRAVKICRELIDSMWS
jgi:hypothetical protein